MKKVIKVAGYQGEASVHTRSMDFFINELSKTFDFEYEKDITLLGKKALLDGKTNNKRIAYVSNKGDGPFGDCDWDPTIKPGEAYF